jgi:iron complex transport system substrate-binding protein
MSRIVTLLLTLLLAQSALAAKYPLTIKDCRAKSITIKREPKRIISLTPSNTEILYALGLGKHIVGVTTWCDYPPAAKKVTKVGDFNTSVEKVIYLKPDLVLAHGTLNNRVIGAIEKHGIKVVALDPKTLDQVMSDIRLVGRITNREREAARAAGHISSTRAQVKGKVAGIKAKPKVLVAVQADPLWAAGPRTFIHEMVTLAGGINLAGDGKPGFSQFSAEAAAWRDPDIIIGTTEGDERVFSKGLWKATKASRTGRVYEIDPDILTRPGPRLADGILAVARLIHPDVFGKH